MAEPATPSVPTINLAVTQAAPTGVAGAAPAAAPAAPAATAFPPPSPARVDWLRKNPANADVFEEFHGPGSAAAALKGTEAAIEKARAEEEAGIADPTAPPKRDALDYVGDIGTGVVSGYAGAIDETAKTISSGLNWVAGKLGSEYEWFDPISYRDALNLKKPETGVGKLAEGVSQFATGLTGVARIAGLKIVTNAGKGLAGGAKLAANVAHLGKVAGAGAVVDFSSFDPYQQGLTDFLEEAAPSTKDAWYTALSTSKDDPELEARLKKAAEGLVIGGVFDSATAAVWAVKLFRAKQSKNYSEAAELFADIPPNGVLADPPDSARGSTLPPGATIEAPPGGVFELPPGAKQTIPGGPTRTADRTPGAIPQSQGPQRLLRNAEDRIAREGIIASEQEVQRAADFISVPEKLTQDNFDKLRLDKLMTTPEDVRLVMAAVESRMAEQPVVSMKELQRAIDDQASVVALRPEDYVARLPQSAGPGGFAAHVMATQRVLGITAEDARSAIEAYVADKSGGNLQAAGEALQRAFSAADAAQFSRAEAGRGLRVLQEQRTPTDKLISKLGKLKPEQLQEAFMVLRDISPESPAQAIKALQQYLDKPTTADLIVQVFKNNVLTGTATHIVNVASNSAKLGGQHFEGIISGAVRLDAQAVAASGRAIYENARALNYALRASGTAIKRGSGVLDPRNASLDNGYHLKNLQDLYDGVNSGNLWQAHLSASKALLGDAALRILGGGDELFKQISYRGKVAGDAWAEGALALKLRGADLDAHVERALRNAIDPVSGRATNAEALAFARETTFTQDLRKDTFFGQLGQRTQNFVGGDGYMAKALQIVVPFVKTPANIIDDFWQRSPLNLTLYNEMVSGSPKVRADAIARFTTGASLSAYAISLAEDGLITGSGPSDPEMKKLWSEDHEAYSIKVGGKWYSYQRFDPAGAHLGLIADAAELMRLAGEDDQLDIIKSVSSMLARQFKSKTFLRGMTELLNGITDPERGGLERLSQNIVGAVVPSLAGSFKDDGYSREVRGLIDAIKNRLPGYSQNLPPRRNMFGEPVLVSEGGNWQPIRQRTDKGDEALQKIVEAYSNTGREFGGLAKTTDGVDWTEFEAPSQATGRLMSAYDRAGEELAAMPVRQVVTSLVNSPGFDALSDELKAQRISATVAKFREAARKKVLAMPEYSELAKQTLIAKYSRRGAPKDLLEQLQ